MKKLIIATVALTALTFASCKKDNLQPTVNSTTNIETSNDDDKAVDARNKFVGTWKATGVMSSGTWDNNGTFLPDETANMKYTLVITKATSNRLKIVEKIYSLNNQLFTTEVLYAKVKTNKVDFSGTKTTQFMNVDFSGKYQTGAKLKYNSNKHFEENNSEINKVTLKKI